MILILLLLLIIIIHCEIVVLMMKLNFSAPRKVTLPIAIHFPHYDPSQSCAHTKFTYFMVFEDHHKKSKSVPAVLILSSSPERCQTSYSQLWDSQSLWIFKDNKRNQFIFYYNHCIRTINWRTKVRMKPIMKEHKWLCAALKITLTWQFSSVHSPLYLLNCWEKLVWYIRAKVNNYVNTQNASTKPRSNAIKQTHSFAKQKQSNSSGKIEKSYSRIFSSICPSWSRDHLGPKVKVFLWSWPKWFMNKTDAVGNVRTIFSIILSLTVD